MGILEPHETSLGHWVDGDDASTVVLGLLQCGQHTGMVGAGVLAHHEDEVSSMDVVQGNGALAHPDGFGERQAAGLMAHVGTIRQVVGAESAHRQLIGKSRFVAGAPRRVKGCRMRRRQSPQFVGNERKRIIPTDRLIVGGTSAQYHGRSQSALLAQPVIGLASQFQNRMRTEELGTHPFGGGLFRHCLGPVLTKLCPTGVVRFRPCAPRAVEPVGLVQLE